jgi:hypothetical protein
MTLSCDPGLMGMRTSSTKGAYGGQAKHQSNHQNLSYLYLYLLLLFFLVKLLYPIPASGIKLPVTILAGLLTSGIRAVDPPWIPPSSLPSMSLPQARRDRS